MCKKSIVNIVRHIAGKFNIGISTLDALLNLQNNQVHDSVIKLLISIPKENALEILQYLRKSKSQLGQDLFVLYELNFKKNGFFVEFGATNGIDLSNTYLLEKEFSWRGILAEPAKCWHKDLKKKRNAFIETSCVWSESDSILSFNETDYAELSTLNSFSFKDVNRDSRKSGKVYDVPTISLNDLLEKYNAPNTIDYLSIDTEGSEFDILNSLDFDKYKFNVITCEHNFTPDREKICDLLSKNGYERRFDELSAVDDWYVRT